MRAKRLASSRISSRCLEYRGAISASSCCISSVAIECATLKNVPSTRSSSRPERSIASIVFVNVGGSADAAIARTWSRCCPTPASNAGR